MKRRIIMQKIDWVSKLTSRKFWVAVAGLVSGLIIFFGGAEGTATQVTALIMSAASVVAIPRLTVCSRTVVSYRYSPVRRFPPRTRLETKN